MVDFDALLKILPIFILAVISPGPDFMMVSSMSLSRGRIEGIKTAAGIATVIIFYTLVCLLGLAALFNSYFWLMIAVKVMGGLYLLYLSIMMWRGSFKAPAPLAASVVPKSKRSSYLMGVFACLTNPKAIAFFASIFAIALTPNTTLATKAAIEVTIPLTAFLWFTFVAYGLSSPKVRARYELWQKAIDRVTGTVLAFFGVKLLLSARG